MEINAPTEASEVLEGQVYTGVVEPGTAAVTSDFVHHLHAFSNLKYYKPFQFIIVFFDPRLCISNLIKTIHKNATNMVSNGMTIHFFTTTFMTSVYVFKC